MIVITLERITGNGLALRDVVGSTTSRDAASALANLSKGHENFLQELARLRINIYFDEVPEISSPQRLMEIMRQKSQSWDLLE